MALDLTLSPPEAALPGRRSGMGHGDLDTRQHQGPSKGLLFCGQVAPGSTGPWPALRSLLHRNLVYRTHQPARWGQLQGGAGPSGGRGIVHDVLSGACSRLAILRSHNVEVGGGLASRSPIGGRGYQEGLRDQAGRVRCHRLLDKQKGFAENIAFDRS